MTAKHLSFTKIMKNFFYGIIATMISCSALNAQSLAQDLAKNQNFIKLQIANEKVLNMPKAATFGANYNSPDLTKGKETYLSNITGFSVSEISSLAYEIGSAGAAVLKDFPSLERMTNVERLELLEAAADIYLSEQRISAACQGCKRKGLSSMSNQTFLGLIAGATLSGPFAIWGGWVGATLGFWQAAEEALDCIRINC